MTSTTVVPVPDFTRGMFLVPSASRPGLNYEASLSVQGAEIRVTCTCPAGRPARHGNSVPCHHARAVCHMLENHHLAHADGRRWLTGEAVGL